MEAFFTMEGVLVVAVCTKKDYMAVALPEFPLADSCWVSVDTEGTKNLSPLACPTLKKENLAHFSTILKYFYTRFD